MKNIKTSSDDFIKIFISKEQSLILNKISPKMWTRLRIEQPCKCFESKRYGIE